jgi:hypothetical protein
MNSEIAERLSIPSQHLNGFIVKLKLRVTSFKSRYA